VRGRQAGCLVLLRDGNDESQVRLDESPLGVVTIPRAAAELALLPCSEVLAARQQITAGAIPRFDLLRQPHLVVLGEQRVLPDIGQVQPDEIFLVPLDALFCHGQTAFLSLHGTVGTTVWESAGYA